MSMDRRSFIASASVVGTLAAIKDEHKIDSVEVLRLRPDDILVLSVPDYLAYEELDRLRDSLSDRLGASQRVLVLTGGMTLSTLSPEDLNRLR